MPDGGVVIGAEQFADRGAQQPLIVNSAARALKRPRHRPDMIILELPGVEMKLGPRVEQRHVDAHAVAAQGGEVVIAGHARCLDRVGLQIANPHDRGGGAGERGGDGGQRTGGDHTGEQRAGGEQTQVGPLDRLDHGRGYRRALRDEAQLEDP